MAKINYYKFVNPGGTKKSPGTATIAGKTYGMKEGGTGDRKLILAANRIGTSLNEQSKVLTSIHKTIVDATKTSIKNDKAVIANLKELRNLERQQNKKAEQERRQRDREAMLAASRRRLQLKEDQVEARPAAKEESESATGESKGGGGLLGALGGLLKSLITYAALKWLSNPENAKKALSFLESLVKVFKVFYKVVEFGVVNLLEGFTNMFASDSGFFDRLKGFLQFIVGGFVTFKAIKWLKNPASIIGDLKMLFNGIKMLPKALGFAARAGKSIVLATKAGITKMRGIPGIGGLAKGAAVVAGGAAVAWGASELLAPRPAADGTLDAATSRGDYTAPTGSIPKMQSGGIVPFKMQSGGIVKAQTGARVIKGRNSGYRAQVGGQTIEAHGTEAVIPIKNRYTDKGGDPLAALLGNSKKMAKAFGSMLTMPFKIGGISILSAVGSVLGMLPFGIGGLFLPIARGLLGPIAQVFGVSPGVINDAFSAVGKGNDKFGEFLGDIVKEWFKAILPGSPANATESPPPSVAPPVPNVTVPEYNLENNKANSAVQLGGKYYTTNDKGAIGDEISADDAKRIVGGVMRPSTPGQWGPMLDLISSGEGNYSSVNPGLQRPEIQEMNLQQLLAFKAKSKKEKGGSAALGRYQFIDPEYAYSLAGINPKEKFTPANQDKMAVAYLEKKRPGKEWLAGKISTRQYIEELSNEWGAFRSYSGNVLPGNSGKIGPEKIEAALNKVKGQRMNHGGVARFGLGGFFDAVGGAIKNVFSSPVGKAIAGVASAVIPGAAPIIAGVGALGGLASGNPIGAITSAASAFFPGASGIINTVGGAIGNVMSGNYAGAIGSLGSLIPGMPDWAGSLINTVGGGIQGLFGGGGFGSLAPILAQGGEMVFGPGFTQLFGGTLDLLNVGGKGLGASDFLKKSGMGALDFAIGKIAGSTGGPDSKSAFVPGGSTVLNINAVKMIGAMLKTQQVAQNTAKIQAMEGVTATLGDKLVKLTGDVIAGVLLDKGKMAELPPAMNMQVLEQVLPMIQSAIASAAQSAQASSGGAASAGLQSSANGSGLVSGIAGTIGSLAGKVLGGKEVK